MKIRVNGEPHSVDRGLVVKDLVMVLGLEGRRIAIEINGEILPPSLRGDYQLAPGDRVEIIEAVGGG